ncbi:unnamed protein product [Lathyrus sativus]|nr:unnamed protein product [Lathyrus sativus]
MLFNNKARSGAIFTIWMACNRRLLTKERMMKFGMTSDGICIFCSMQESLDHPFFEFDYTKVLWEQVLAWLSDNHNSGGWTIEQG